jgi:recombinational DNA repair protein RecT
MDADELEAARRQSNASNSPAWNRFSGEMYRKVILHRTCKHLDTDLSAEQKEIMTQGIDIAVDPKEIRDKDVEGVATEAFDMDAVVYED